MQGRRGSVRQDRIRATSKDRGHPEPFAAQEVARYEGINGAVDAVESASSNTALKCIRADAQRADLPPREHGLLHAGKLHDDLVT